MTRKLITILSIAGSDCTGGAGIQADIKAAAMRGVYSTTAVTAVSIQNSKGVDEIIFMSPDCVRKQILAVFDDCIPDAIKIGMLGSAEIIKTVAETIKELADGIPIVADPVMQATAGGALLDNKTAVTATYKNELCPLATVVTPNLDEARYLSGCMAESDEEIAKALIATLRCKAVALKGGHSEGSTVSDVLAYETATGTVELKKVSSPRLNCGNLHGTGCTFSTLLAAELAKGNTLTQSFISASSIMKAIIADSSRYHFGESGYGPLNLLNYLTQ